MPVLQCKTCGAQLKVDERFLGKAVRCPRCKQISEVQPQQTDATPDLEFAGVNVQRKTSVSGRRGRRRKKSVLFQTAVIVASIVSVTAAGIAVIITQSSSRELTLDTIADQTVTELQSLKLTVAVDDAESWGETIDFELIEGPKGAALDEKTGVFKWTPSERDGPGRYSVAIRAKTLGLAAESRPQTFSISVTEQNQPPVIGPIDDLSVSSGESVAIQLHATDPDLPAQKLQFRLGKQAPSLARIHPQSGIFSWQPTNNDAGRKHKVAIVVSESRRGGKSATAEFQIQVRPAAAVSEIPLSSIPTPDLASVNNLPATDLPNPLKNPETGPFTQHEINALAALFSERQLFSPKRYKELRTIFAKRFARLHADDIRAAFGSQHEETIAWLAENANLRDELYMAINPETDKVVEALSLFKQLKDEFPGRVVRYGNLAIAIAVTWDNPGSIYDYGRHQRRAKTTMPEDLIGPMENFRYFVVAEKFMQGRAQWLPWEFLVYVVNHKTPLKEREWALRAYLPKRVMFGKCYSDVPYDYLMLNTESERARLNGQVYNLPNLLGFGGVCAHQADYASRVGQSLGVPAAAVRGKSTSGEGHGWVMWVEVKAVSSTSVAFTLQSHGRYRGDRYYVGTLKDPRTGKSITDRQLELRLHTVGFDATAKRQAEMAMAAYPVLLEYNSMDVSEQISFLSDTVRLCPSNEAAWLAVAKMAANETVRKKHKKQMFGIIDELFLTFSNFPDFTWEVFDDLSQIEERLDKRIELYNRLAMMYVAAKRPDLACEARLKLTELYVADGQQQTAIDGLASTIYVFVEEGRYVPRMLDRLESLCQNAEDSTPALLAFYNTFLPKIPQMRGNRPSPYCMEMFERGIAKFKQYGHSQVALAYEVQLARIKAGQGRKK